MMNEGNENYVETIGKSNTHCKKEISAIDKSDEEGGHSLDSDTGGIEENDFMEFGERSRDVEPQRADTLVIVPTAEDLEENDNTDEDGSPPLIEDDIHEKTFSKCDEKTTDTSKTSETGSPQKSKNDVIVSKFEEKNTATHDDSLVFSCLFLACSFSTTSRDELKKHYSKNHKPKEWKDEPNDDLDTYTCTKCTFIADTKDELDEHDKEEHTSVKCPHCSVVSDSIISHNEHVSAKHPKRMKNACPHCPKAFLSPYMLINHVREVHNKEKAHKCPYCSYIAKRNQHVISHIRFKHTLESEDARYKCSKCEYTSPMKSRMIDHQNSVHNFKRLHCPHCNTYSTLHEINLAAHIKSKHEVKQRFECTQCSFSTSVEELLRKHRRLVHEKVLHVECLYCDDYLAPTETHMKWHVNKCHRVAVNKIAQAAEARKRDAALLEARRQEAKLDREREEERLEDARKQRKERELAEKMRPNIGKNISLKDPSLTNTVPTPLRMELIALNNEGDVITFQLTADDADKNDEAPGNGVQIKETGHVDRGFMDDDDDGNDHIGGGGGGMIEYTTTHGGGDDENDQQQIIINNSEYNVVVESNEPHFVDMENNSGGYESSAPAKKRGRGRRAKKKKSDVGNMKEEFKCSDCNLTFDANCRLLAHENQVHLKDKPYKCKLCNYSASRKNHIKSHLLTHLKKQKRQREKKFACDECEYSSDLSEMHLFFHKKQKHDDKKVVSCTFDPDCIFSCKFAFQMNTHIKAFHHGIKDFKCGECNFSTSHKVSLQLHYASQHRKQKTHFCALCTYATYSKHQLAYHFKIEHDTTYKHWKCDICVLSFKSKGNLTAHERAVHLKIKPYKCHYCEYSASRKSHIKNHMRIHAAEFIGYGQMEYEDYTDEEDDGDEEMEVNETNSNSSLHRQLFHPPTSSKPLPSDSSQDCIDVNHRKDLELAGNESDGKDLFSIEEPVSMSEDQFDKVNKNETVVEKEQVFEPDNLKI